MIEYYLQIKHAHISLVLASGGLFALRGLGMLANMRWPLASFVRYFSYGVDTALLTAALMLLVILKLNPFAVPWLAVKLGLLVAYIALGWFALSRNRGPIGRPLTYFAALACFGFMYTIARAHHPLGFLQALLT